MTPVRKIAVLIASLALTAIVVVAFGAYFVNVILDEELLIDQAGVVFEIRPGMSFTAISTALAERNIVSRPEVLTLYGRVSGKAGSVRAGEYRIEPGMSMRSLLDKFVAGEVVLHSFTIIEGWTFRELAAELKQHPALEHVFDYDDWPELLASFAAGGEENAQLAGGATHPEGLFLPETYHFPRNTSDADLLRQAFDLMQVTLREEWERRRADLPLASPYEALVLASIVEKETAREDERARIAGVFVRRLQKRMRLQTDPTVIYGIGVDFNGNLTRKDLRTDTAYNTYTRGGLPPTPIALPGRAAIRAALQPADGNELYFVATGQGDGSHKFSATKAEHDAAVREYLERQRAAARSEGGQ
jgi:UPF0755 protein